LKSEEIAMDEIYTYEPKLLGLSRRFVGAILGILLFLLITVPVYKYQLQIRPLNYLVAGLTSPGIVTWFIIMFTFESGQLPLATSFILLDLMIFGFSSIPSAVIGSFSISTQKPRRSIGLLLLVLYLLIALGCGLLFYGFLS
jgi:hypothetical protein